MGSESSTTTANLHKRDAYQPYYIKLILFVTALTFLGVVKFDFVYDDFSQFVFNPFLRSWRYATDYFFSPSWKLMPPGTLEAHYNPLFLVLMRICNASFANRPLGWHVVSLCFHLLVTWLTYVVVKKMTGQFTTAWLSALIFGLHPMHHEVVAWISATTESLVAVTFLLAFLAYLKSRDGSKVFWTAVSCAMYVLALLSMETAIVLPALIFAYAWMRFVPVDANNGAAYSERFKSAFKATALYLPLAVFYVLGRDRMLSGFAHGHSNVSITTWFLTLPSILWFYIRNWLFPVRLSEYYDLFYQTNLNFRHVVLPLMLLVLLSFGLWYLRRRFRSMDIDCAVAWIVITMLPALNIAHSSPDELVHDRYFYVPSIGAAMLVGLIIERFATSQAELFGMPRRVVISGLASALLLVFFGSKAVSVWADDYSVFSNAHTVAPLNATAVSKLGAEMITRGELKSAESMLEAGLQSNPRDFRFTFNLGRLYYREGNYPKAEIFILRTIELNPDMADAYVTLGQIRLKQDRLGEARTSLRQAVDMNPYSAPFHTIYGVSLALSGDCNAANEQYKMALVLNPGDGLTEIQAQRCQSASPPVPAKPATVNRGQS